MEDDTPQNEAQGTFANSLLPYGTWIEDAYRVANRDIMLRALDHAAEGGLPGGHHFYLTFRTDHAGVAMPQRLRAQYPAEMTIVLQHQFWDLNVDRDAHLVSVGLSFGGVPTTLVIPFDAITAFADPEVQFGLRIEPIPGTPDQAEPGPAGHADVTQADFARADLARADHGRPDAEPAPGATAEEPDATPQVISLDAFRRRDQ